MASTDSSDPRSHGVEPDAVVAVRIEGKLLGEDYEGEHKSYDVEYFHPACADAGTDLFESVNERDYEVRAFELNWDDPCECPVCEVSIT